MQLLRFISTKLYRQLWLAAPIVIWFSYWPNFTLGSNPTMNLELSLPLIYLTILAMCGLIMIWQTKQRIYDDPFILVSSLFVLLSGITVFWSPNQLRGWLTFGVTAVIWLVFVSAWIDRLYFRKVIMTKLISVLITTSIIACLLAIAQMIAGAFLADRELTGLCLGCAANQFGFARPNLFSLEPQFFGSLLLAPALIIFYRLITAPRKLKTWIIFVLLVTTIGLTLSRGAIYALIIGMLVEAIFVRGQILSKLAMIDALIVSTLLCLFVQGGLAAINPHIKETFWGAITKSIDHVSLGLVDLRDKTSQIEKSSSDSPAMTSLSDSEKNTTPEKPRYSGYVAESTNVRVDLSRIALLAWLDQDAWHRLFGAGLGSAGKEMAKQIGSTYEKEIVQNEFVEVFLERGVVGFLLLLATIAIAFYRTKRSLWVWGILTAYLCQYLFFSGLPNALHIYILLTMLYCAAASEYLPRRFQ